jgi:AcrR family transcriptional regulator
MTGQQRRAQLLDVARQLFAERGFEAASIEEIAHRAGVSKPIVYEHFGTKEGIYEVVKDREVQALIAQVTEALVGDHPRILLEQAATALLTYIETQTDGFRILVRESPVASTTGIFASVIGDIAVQVEYILADQFKRRGYNTKLAPLYSHALVGMVALSGQWWLDARKPSRDDVTSHLVNLAWNGLGNLEPKPALRTKR